MESHFEDDFFIPPGFPAFPTYPYYSECEEIVVSNTSIMLVVEKRPENLIQDNKSAKKL